MVRNGDGEGALAWVERWAVRAIRRVIYQRMTISLVSPSWYDQLARATARDGWEVVRADGTLVQLRRPRFRPRRPRWNPPPQWPEALSRRILIADRSALTEWEDTASGGSPR